MLPIGLSMSPVSLKKLCRVLSPAAYPFLYPVYLSVCVYLLIYQ